MRRLLRFSFFAVFLLAGFSSVEAQDQRPRFRPAVLGSGPASLINRIDTAALIKAGQKEGAVMFCGRVGKDGGLLEARTYRGSPETTALEEELRKRLVDAKVAPAIYERQPVEVLLFGTVLFSGANDEPPLRIFLNQDPAELKNGSDFIAPQPVFGGASKFSGLSHPQEKQAVPVAGIVSLTVRVDANGVPQAIQVLSEDPPSLGFGEAALHDFEGAQFIPAFRDGDPGDCDTILPIYYQKD